MSKTPRSKTAPHDEAWWQHELAQVSLSGRRWLGKHYPTIRHVHDDLVSETLVQVTEHLLDRPVRLPPSWFQEAAPPEDDIRRFHGFVLTVLKRRVMDQFRTEFRQWTQKLSLDEAGNKSVLVAQDEGDDLDRSLDINRTAKALMIILAGMSEENRLLMEEVALGGRDRAYDANERQRVKRLRQQLIRELTVVLGNDPMELLQKS